MVVRVGPGGAEADDVGGLAAAAVPQGVVDLSWVVWCCCWLGVGVLGWKRGQGQRVWRCVASLDLITLSIL